MGVLKGCEDKLITEYRINNKTVISADDNKDYFIIKSRKKNGDKDLREMCRGEDAPLEYIGKSGQWFSYKAPRDFMLVHFPELYMQLYSNSIYGVITNLPL